MGIPSWFSYIVRKHRSILINYQSKRNGHPQSLYGFVNSLIYDSIHELDDKKGHINDIETTIITMVCDRNRHINTIISSKETSL